MTTRDQLEQLDRLQNSLERDICNFALDEWEDLYEEKVVCRRFVFGRGNTTYEVIVNPVGQIRSMDDRSPIDLIQQIGNGSLCSLYEQVCGRI